MSEYDDNGVICSMSFRIMSPNGPLSYRLPINTQGVYKALMSDRKVPKRLKTKEQAARVALRILKDWIEAQIAIVEAEMADLKEVFLPYAQNTEGKTLYEIASGNDFKLLTG